MQAAFHDANGTQILSDLMVGYPFAAENPSLCLKPHQQAGLSYGNHFQPYPAYYLWQQLQKVHHLQGSMDLAYYCQHVIPHIIGQFQAAAKATVPLVPAFERAVAGGQGLAELKELRPMDLSFFVTMLSEYLDHVVSAADMLHVYVSLQLYSHNVHDSNVCSGCAGLHRSLLHV